MLLSSCYRANVGTKEDKFIFFYGRSAFPVVHIRRPRDEVKRFEFYHDYMQIDLCLLNEGGDTVPFLPSSMASRHPLYSRDDPEFEWIMEGDEDMEYAGCLLFGSSCDSRTDILTARVASVHTALGLRELTLLQLRHVLSLAVSDFDARGLCVMLEAFQEKERGD